jgi:hypothetical protein
LHLRSFVLGCSWRYTPAVSFKKKAQFLAWLLGTPWKSEGLEENNAYTAPLALATLLKLADTTVLDKERPRAAVSSLGNDLKVSRSGAISMSGYPPNGFLTYWTVRALGDAVVHYEKGWWSGTLDEVEAVKKSIELAAAWAEGEAYRQIAYYHANDLDRYDALQLGYALCIVDIIKANSGKDLDRVLSKKGLEILFISQLANGLWSKGVPLFHYGDAGSVYPFAFETLTAVMRLGFREKVEHPTLSVEFFEPHIDRLLKTLRWAETHEVAKEGLHGWRSNHVLPGTSPQAWATAMVLSFVRGLDVLFQRIVQENLLNEFDARRFVRRTDVVPSAASWTRIADSETAITSGDDTTIKKLLFDYLLAPHLSDISLQLGKQKKRWSAIFFGPPGTAKTTLAEEIAATLGWPLVTLETSDFLAQGVDKMAFQAQILFRRLEYLQQVVVFIDEVEEFVRARHDTDRQSRLTTTAMLTLLQRFRGKRRAILILATNHMEVFDPAIARPGRFDLLVLVKPPSFFSKVLLWRGWHSQLSGEILHGEEETLHSNVTLVERFTYDEWFAFAEFYGQQPGRSEPGHENLLARLLREAGNHLTISKQDWKVWMTRKSAVR